MDRGSWMNGMANRWMDARKWIDGLRWMDW